MHPPEARFLLIGQAASVASPRLFTINRNTVHVRRNTQFGKERAAQLQVVCSDVWKAYLNVIRKRTGQPCTYSTAPMSQASSAR